MKLYGSRNSRSLRCVWALEEAGATYDYQRIWMMKGEGQSPAFKAINPAGKIPVLQDGTMTLTELVAFVQKFARETGCYDIRIGDYVTANIEEPLQLQLHTRWLTDFTTRFCDITTSPTLVH